MTLVSRDIQTTLSVAADLTKQYRLECKKASIQPSQAILAKLAVCYFRFMITNIA